MVIPIVNVKYLLKGNILRFVSKSFFINKFKMAYMCAVLEMIVQKEEIYSRVEAHGGKFSKNMYIPL